MPFEHDLVEEQPDAFDPMRHFGNPADDFERTDALEQDRRNCGLRAVLNEHEAAADREQPKRQDKPARTVAGNQRERRRPTDREPADPASRLHRHREIEGDAAAKRDRQP